MTLYSSDSILLVFLIVQINYLKFMNAVNYFISYIYDKITTIGNTRNYFSGPTISIISGINADRLPLFYFCVTLIVYVCVFSVIFSVVLNFIMVRMKNKRIKSSSFCPVEAVTMTVFFTGIFFLIKYRIGSFGLEDGSVNRSVIITGLLIMVTGAVINIIARINLGANWSNSMRIYEGQKIITKGMYGIVRHPLFLSLILLFTGSSLIYKNYLVFAATCLLFVPAMIYRAKKEEEILKKEFPEYIAYAVKVPMLFPVISSRRKNENKHK
jgi:protein-S-isoprenylcysteine O-methyltransferase Ste14